MRDCNPPPEGIRWIKGKDGKKGYCEEPKERERKSQSPKDIRIRSKSVEKIPLIKNVDKIDCEIPYVWVKSLNGNDHKCILLPKDIRDKVYYYQNPHKSVFSTITIYGATRSSINVTHEGKKYQSIKSIVYEKSRKKFREIRWSNNDKFYYNRELRLVVVVKVDQNEMYRMNMTDEDNKKFARLITLIYTGIANVEYEEVNKKNIPDDINFIVYKSQTDQESFIREKYNVFSNVRTKVYRFNMIGRRRNNDLVFDVNINIRIIDDVPLQFVRSIIKDTLYSIVVNNLNMRGVEIPLANIMDDIEISSNIREIDANNIIHYNLEIDLPMYFNFSAIKPYYIKLIDDRGIILGRPIRRLLPNNLLLDRNYGILREIFLQQNQINEAYRAMIEQAERRPIRRNVVNNDLEWEGPGPEPEWWRQMRAQNVHGNDKIKAIDQKIKELLKDPIEIDEKEAAIEFSKAINNRITIQQILTCHTVTYGFGDVYMQNRVRNLREDQKVEMCLLFTKIWQRIRNVKDDEMRKELTTRLEEEMKDIVAGTCATGWATRLINSISGFDINVKCKPSPADTIREMKEYILPYSQKKLDELDEKSQDIIMEGMMGGEYANDYNRFLDQLKPELLNIFMKDYKDSGLTMNDIKDCLNEAIKKLYAVE